MKKGMILVIAVLCSSVVCGCTHLKSDKLEGKKNTPLGLTYRLPAKQFTIKTTYEITGCKKRETKDGDPLKADLEANISVSLSESLIGAEAYTIDYQILNGLTKITNTEFQLSEAGLLTGVNTSITDQSKAILTNSVTAAASIARAVALPIPTGVSEIFGNSLKDLNKSIMSQAGKPFDYNKLLQLQPDIQSNALKKPLERLSKFHGKKIDVKRQKEMTQLIEDPCDPIKKALASKEEAEKNLEKEKINDKKRMEFEEKIRQADLQIKALTDLVDTYNKLGDKVEKQKLLERVKLQEKVKEEAAASLKVLGESKTDNLTKKLVEAKRKLSVVGSKDFVPRAKDNPEVVPVTTVELAPLLENGLDYKLNFRSSKKLVTCCNY